MNSAFGYFCSALDMGLELTPATPGIFAICIEVVSNAWNFSPNSHRKFRAKGGPEEMYGAIPDKLARENVLKDLFLLHSLRNKTGSHFSLHIERERIELTNELRDWMVRRGCSKNFAEISFVPDRLLEDLQRSGHSIYKTALTVARRGFFIALDAVELFHVAEHDMQA